MIGYCAAAVNDCLLGSIPLPRRRDPDWVSRRRPPRRARHLHTRHDVAYSDGSRGSAHGGRDSAVKFIDELKRRNVIRVAAVYLGVSWALIQVGEQVIIALRLPSWSATFIFVMLALGLPVAMIVAWAFEMTPEGMRRTQEVEGFHPTRTPAKVGDYFLILVGAVIAGYIVYDLEFRDTVSVEAGALDIEAVAVLPFANLSVEPEQEGVSRALTAEVRNRLTRLPGLRVVAGTASAKPFEETDVKAIGDALGVPVVLDGSVQRSGSKLRVMAQLVDTRDGVQLWSKTFNRDVADILAVQDDLSQAIVDDVRKAITPVPKELAETGRASAVAAQAKLLETGRAQLAQRSAEGLRAAVATFEQAIQANPRSAPAYAAMAEALLLQGRGWDTYGAVPPADAVAKARPYAAKALALDPASAEAQAVGGLIELAAGDRERAIGALRRSIERNPGIARARLWLYQAYALEGRLEEAVPQLRRAHELDPDSLAVGLNMSRLLAMTDRQLEADTLLDRLERLYPGNENVLAARGARLADDWRPADAIQVLHRAHKANPSDQRVRRLIGLAYLDVGAGVEAERWLESDRSAVLLAMGRPTDALAEARRGFAADPGDPERIFALADAEAAAGNPRGAVDLLAPFEAASRDGAGPLYGRAPAVMPALTLAAARRATGDEAGAQAVLDGTASWLARQRKLGFEHPCFAYLEARIAAMRGDPGPAMEALRRAVSRRFAGVSVVGWDPALASLRALPEYRALLADLEADRAQRRARIEDMGLMGAS
jgi:TolB-like protein/predicted Zn-dependent protease